MVWTLSSLRRCVKGSTGRLPGPAGTGSARTPGSPGKRIMLILADQRFLDAITVSRFLNRAPFSAPPSRTVFSGKWGRDRLQ
ncbi:hypothetical protein L083_0713 [Actinoplanes sp. N902-109]|nr:hypothetical protein L083_0713 [Actinoplanes sp. N902-109]